MRYFLACIVEQVDERTFWARLCGIDKMVKCYLSYELFRNSTPVLVGDLVILQYNEGLRRIKKRFYYIIKVI